MNKKFGQKYAENLCIILIDILSVPLFTHMVLFLLMTYLDLYIASLKTIQKQENFITNKEKSLEMLGNIHPPMQANS